MKLELIAFTDRGNALAQALAEGLNRAGHTAACTRREGQRAGEWAQSAFHRAQGLIFVGAVGIAVRSIAPLLGHKSTDPAVVAVDERGGFAVPILSGHLGGANGLAREIAALLGGQAVITTATDLNGVFAVDQWARAQGLFVRNPEKIVDVSAALLAGKRVSFWSRWPVAGEMPDGLVWAEREAAEVAVDWTDGAAPAKPPLWLCPRTLRLGMGCKKGASPEAVCGLALEVLKGAGAPCQAVEAVCTIGLKKDEPGLLALCRGLDVPLAGYSAGELARIPGRFTASPFVKKAVGVDNVCERSALAEGGTLLVKKTARNGVTAALAGRTPDLNWRT